jgi:hypothetical protein
MPKSSRQFRQLTEKQDKATQQLTSGLEDLSAKLSSLIDVMAEQKKQQSGLSANLEKIYIQNRRSEGKGLREERKRNAERLSEIRKIRTKKRFERDFPEPKIAEGSKELLSGGFLGEGGAGKFLGGLAGFALAGLFGEASREKKRLQEEERVLKEEELLLKQSDKEIISQLKLLNSNFKLQTSSLESSLEDQKYELRDSLDGISEGVQKVEVINLGETNDKLQKILDNLPGVAAPTVAPGVLDWLTSFAKKGAKWVFEGITAVEAGSVAVLAVPAVLAAVATKLGLDRLDEAAAKQKEAETALKLQEEKLAAAQKTFEEEKKTYEANKANLSEQERLVKEAELKTKEQTLSATAIAQLDKAAEITYDTSNALANLTADATGIGEAYVQQAIAEQKQAEIVRNRKLMSQGITPGQMQTVSNETLQQWIDYQKKTLEEEAKRREGLFGFMSGKMRQEDIAVMKREMEANIKEAQKRGIKIPTGSAAAPAPTAPSRKREEGTGAGTPTVTAPGAAPSREGQIALPGWVLGSLTKKFESGENFAAANVDTKTGFSFGAYQMFSKGALPGFLKYLNKNNPEAYKRLAQRENKVLTPDELIKEVQGDVGKKTTPLMETWRQVFSDKTLGKLQEKYMASSSGNFADVAGSVKGLSNLLESARSNRIGQVLNDLIFDMANTTTAGARDVLRKSLSGVNLSDTSSSNLLEILNKVYKVATSREWYPDPSKFSGGIQEAQKYQKILMERFSSIYGYINSSPTASNNQNNTGAGMYNNSFATQHGLNTPIVIAPSTSQTNNNINVGGSSGKGGTPNPMPAGANSAAAATKSARGK